MVGTGVLMSQLLLEYVLDTTQDLEKRQWVYELWHMSHDESWWVMMSHDESWWVMMSHVMMSCHMYRCQQHSVIFCGCNFIWHSWFWVDTILGHPMSSPIPNMLNMIERFERKEYYGTALKATYSVFEATFSGSWPLLARNLIRDVSEWFLGEFRVLRVLRVLRVQRFDHNSTSRLRPVSRDSLDLSRSQ